MPQKQKNRYPLKIVSGFMVLSFLVVLVGYFMYSEFNTYLELQEKETDNTKLLNVNNLLTSIYEAENLSKRTLLNNNDQFFTAFAKKVDSITQDIEVLKRLAENEAQVSKLDSIQELLRQKVNNNGILRNLKKKDAGLAPLDTLLKVFQDMESDLGRIVPERLVRNFDSLPLATQNSLREYASLLNRNIPKPPSYDDANSLLDSLLILSKTALKDAKIAQNRLNHSMAQRELQIFRSDLELSEQLKDITASLERETAANNQTELLGKQRLLTRSGRWAWIAGAMALATIILFTVLTARDYWKGQLYRERLEKEKQYSDGLLASREQLISMVSHDLRSPLNSISGFAELLETRPDPENQRKYLEQLRSATGYAEHLMNDLLDFSELEAGRLTISPRPYNLSVLLKRLVSEYQETSAQKSIRLELEVTKEIQKPILGDSLRIRQILTNLVGNAFKFTEKGTIKIKAYVSHTEKLPKLHIQVSDTGVGIPKNKLEAVFQEFVQANTTDRKRYGGHGLGLTISRKIARLMNGDLTVTSQLGKGSVFTLNLPFQESEVEDVPKVKRKERHPSIAILDDDQSLLQLLQELCSLHKIPQQSFTSFQNFKKQCTTEYTMLFTDIEMPETDGFQVIEQLKLGEVPHYSNQPIIAMTGKRDISENKFLEKGFDSVLAKPFSSAAFLHLLGSYGIVGATKTLNQLDTKNDKNALFSIDLISEFVPDKQSLVEVLYTFIENSSGNLASLLNAIQKEDHPKIGNIAHRMLPMFRQLKVESMVPILDKLEHNSLLISQADLIQQGNRLQQYFSDLKKAIADYIFKISVDID